MGTESAAGGPGGPAQRIAAGYTVEGQALQLGTVVVDGEPRSIFGTGRRRRK